MSECKVKSVCCRYLSLCSLSVFQNSHLYMDISEICLLPLLMSVFIVCQNSHLYVDINLLPLLVSMCCAGDCGAIPQRKGAAHVGQNQVFGASGADHVSVPDNHQVCDHVSSIFVASSSTPIYLN